MRRIPTLGRAVLHVVELRAKKQMLDIHTSWVIALVEDIKPIWDFPVGK